MAPNPAMNDLAGISNSVAMGPLYTTMCCIISIQPELDSI